MKPGKRLVILIFLTAAVLLVASMVFTYQIGLIAVRAERKMTTQLSVLNQLEEFLSALKDTETGQRRYLLTSEEAYLDPYTNKRAEVKAKLGSLHHLTLIGELPKERVERVSVLTQQKLVELDRTIQVSREKGLGAALAIVRDDTGRRVMDQIRDEIGELRTAEQNEFEEASLRADRVGALRTETFIGAGLLNLAFLGWSFRKMSEEMRRREAAVLEASRQKELLVTTLASIGDAVIVTDAQGRIISLNREAEQLTGWKTSEAEGQWLPDVFRIVSEETRQPVENPVEKVFRVGAVVGLTNHTLLLAKDGAEVPIDDSAAPIRQPGGSIAGVVLVFRDFTERRRAQLVLERSKEELESLVAERTSKLHEMVNELQHVSYAISHDMRAPLRAMGAFAGFLLEKASTNGSAEMKDYSRRIVVAAGRLDKLIQDALHYTKAVLQEMKPESVDLEKLVRDLLDTYPNLQPDQADIRIEGKLPVVLGNEALLTQCFSNLLGNAVKFVPPGTRPEVSIHAGLNGDTVRIWVKDNGIGIPEHSQERLFKMFQRLTNDYEGSGVGLAIVRKVAERMGGKVGAESESGKGSRFWVDLRLANHKSASGVITPESSAHRD